MQRMDTRHHSKKNRIISASKGFRVISKLDIDVQTLGGLDINGVFNKIDVCTSAGHPR